MSTLARYTDVTETRGEWFSATYRRVIDVTITRAKGQADYHGTAYVGGYPIAEMAYIGYSWDEVKRRFKQTIEDEIAAIAAREGWV